MLVKLHLEDFRVFEDQTIDFTDGITAIVGPNGSGKTTILEAIEFALFRNAKRKEKDLVFKDIIRHGAKKAKVILTFNSPVNDRRYTVKRTIFVNRTEAELIDETKNSVVASSITQVNKEVVKVLGMNRDAFAALTYVRQGDIDRLSRLAPKKKQETLRNMMGLGIYGDIESKVRKKEREYKKDITRIEGEQQRLQEIKGHLPSIEDVGHAKRALDELRTLVQRPDLIKPLTKVIIQVRESIGEVDRQLSSLEHTQIKEELLHKSELAKKLQTVLSQIPIIAEEDLKPRIRQEARVIFLNIFGDRYSNLEIGDDYNIKLYNLRGHLVTLRDASGGEDVCVNFSLRVAVNTALQKMIADGNKDLMKVPSLLILDEPGTGLDSLRRRWLPEAIRGLKEVSQVLVVTHMEELRGAADTIINLEPQGKNRPPKITIEQ